ncbi:hypothetical protein [Oricola indica]|jgi:hypothetical protein|uniref:hypothetical protein n=1 Tax=Oricola indica TaxID=2872591 RepID=UPI001CBBC15F|nr:hypothetical protein [Oricola indica]
MIPSILHFLGVTPQGGGKTGKREAAWAFTLIPLVLTLMLVGLAVAGYFAGGDIEPIINLISALREVLIFLWTAAAGFLTTAYGLEWRSKQSPRVQEHEAETDPLGGITVPDGAVG